MRLKKTPNLLFLKSIALLFVLSAFSAFLLSPACMLNPKLDIITAETLVPGSLQITVLSQNTMLIPLDIAAPEYVKRTGLVSEMLADGEFDVAGLQEVFAGISQDSILKAWHLNAISGSAGLWQPITGAKEVSLLSESKNSFGIEILDARPNEKSAKISFGTYYVLGPDTESFNIFKQDSGLLILSRFPIIAASAFSFSDAQGSDRLANKGAVYARIKIGPSNDDYIHFFNTHLQSHGYEDTRFRNLNELLIFVSNVLADDLGSPDGSVTQNGKNVNKDTKSQKDMNVAKEVQATQKDISEVSDSSSQEGNCGPPMQSIHPIIMVGDFNIKAGMPDGWIKKAHIISSPQGQKMPDDSDTVLNASADYNKFMDLLKSFAEAFIHGGNPDEVLSGPAMAAETGTETMAAKMTGTAMVAGWETATATGAQENLLILEDLWKEFYPDDPGFTWIGKGWKTGTQNPYGTDGNQFATETGPPERIDYVVFFKGSGTLQLNPSSIKLFPEDSSGLQVSDHLGIVSVFDWHY